MQVWSRDPITSKLTRSSSSLKPEPKLDPVMALPISLQDRFYSIRTSFHLAFGSQEPMAIFLNSSHNSSTLSQSFMV